MDGRSMKRFGVAVSLALMSLLVVSQAAFAGEWNPATGDVAAKVHGGSLCLFNGRDQPDETAPGAGDGESTVPFADDGLWGSTPAGGKVQSYGQIVASGGKDFVPSPGVACNPTSGFEE